MPVDSLDIPKQLLTAKLPSAPQVLLELMSLCDRDDVGMAEIASAVAKDAGLASRIVSVANSPLHRPGRALENINQCLAVLGTSAVRRLALNQSVAELFGRFQRAARYDLRRFWFHGLSVAVTARKLALHLGYANSEEAYLAGLLHDVGRLALLSIAADRYLPMFGAFTGEQELMRQEQALFGLTHAEVGAWLAERWKLHALLIDSILYHHESIDRVRQAHPLVQIVMLANLINTPASPELAASQADLAFWHLDPPQVMDMLESVQAEVRGVAAELGIELPDQAATAPVEDASTGASWKQLAGAVSERLEGLLALPEIPARGAFDDAVADLLRSAALLFGARGIALFLPEGDELRWQRSDGGESPADGRALEIRIACSSDQSRIALAYRGHIGLAVQRADSGHLADAQVLRQLGGQGLLCLPLASEGKHLGALAVGLDPPMLDRFAGAQTLLVTFAREAGRHLGLALDRRGQREAARNEVAHRYELHARQLVHEANNPLGVVRNYLAILRQQLADQEQAQQDIELIEDELRRVARILQQMRHLDVPEEAPGYAGQVRVSVSVNVNALVRDVVQFCRLGKREVERVEIGFTPAADLPPVAVEADKLKQVLTNLIFNAAEAMHGQGRIDLSTAFWQTGKDRNTLEITVADNGPGLPRDVLDHLYQPVRTAKGEAHSGLGLSIVAGLVQGMGGILQCSSGPSGTRFKVHLPVVSHAA